MLCRCLTVISRISAFSNFDCCLHKKRARVKIREQLMLNIHNKCVTSQLFITKLYDRVVLYCMMLSKMRHRVSQIIHHVHLVNKCHQDPPTFRKDAMWLTWQTDNHRSFPVFLKKNLFLKHFKDQILWTLFSPLTASCSGKLFVYFPAGNRGVYREA